METVGVATRTQFRFYTYVHYRASDGLPFYVGKGSDARANDRTGRSEYWKCVVRKHGWRAEIVAHWLMESDAFEHERALISEYRGAGLRLCNLTDGGEGVSGYIYTPEHRAKIAARSRESWTDPERRAKHTAAISGQKRSAEARAKMGAARKGRVVISPEQRAAISAANKGIVRSPEFKARIVAALTGRPCSEETRRKISEAHKGRAPSPEMRRRISQTLTGRRLSDEEKARLYALQHGPEQRAKHSAAMKGRPWSAARRAAYEAKEVAQF